MTDAFPSPDVASWYERRTFIDVGDVGSLLGRKRALGWKVGIGIPTLDEAATIGSICSTVRSLMGEAEPLVDRLVVIDTGSSDDTRSLATEAGAEVFGIEGSPAPNGGKGSALHKSLEVLNDCDIVVWLDGDVENFGSRFVTGLLDPLLRNETILFAKGFYERPLRSGSELSQGGARVTELVARPLLNLLCPELSGVIQPLAGECSFRRSAVEGLRLFTGYGVDIGLLLDVHEKHGLDAVAQVDLGVRVHDNKDLPALGRMAHQVLQAMLIRFEGYGRLKLLDEPSPMLVQFDPEASSSDLAIQELPPI